MATFTLDQLVTDDDSMFVPATSADDVPVGFEERAYKEAEPRIIEGGEAIGKTPYPADQMKAAAYASIMIATDERLRALSKQFDPMNFFDNLIAPNIPLIGDQFRRKLTSYQKKQYDKNSQRFIEMILRDETGAAATQGEVDRLMGTFVPDFGWSPEELDDLQQMRNMHINRVLGKAGKAYEYFENNLEKAKAYIIERDKEDDRKRLIKMANYKDNGDRSPAGRELHKKALMDRATARAYLDQQGIPYERDVNLPFDEEGRIKR